MQDIIVQAFVARIQADLMVIDQVPEIYRNQVTDLLGSEVNADVH